MYIVNVKIQVFPPLSADFLAATLDNARGTRSEPGNLRFDVLQMESDSCRFCLYEVYLDEAAFKAHQQTPHYLRWKDLVAPMMAAPRVGEKYHSLFPEPWT
jgi:(4S)-4-hydroxy-5-phosphonooxypentane-2,3-dione isomerase